MTTDSPKFHRGIPVSSDSIKCANCWRIFGKPTEGDFGCPYCDSEIERVVPTREKILQQALEIVTKDRNTDYGNPEDNFKVIADLWNVYLAARGTNARVDAKDVAAMMILMKMSRIVTSPGKEDHWVDIAGYSACGAECSGSSR